MDGYNNKPPKISIVVPFYNIENYVAQCLDSILGQTMPDFEIIAVNDGSTDTTPDLLKKYIDKDCRIKIVHLENGGLSWARNHGVMRATGEYLMFVDGDDFILPDCLSKLYNCAKTNSADVVVFCYMRCIDGVIKNPQKFSYLKDTMIDTFSAMQIMLLEGDDTVWNKMVRREMYIKNNIFFEEGTVHEDIPVTCKMLIEAERIFYLEEYLYVYVQRNTSIVYSPKTLKNIKDWIHNINIMGEIIKKSPWYDELSIAFEYKYNNILIAELFRCYSNFERYKSYKDLEEAKKFLEEKFFAISLKRIFSNPYFKLRYKLKIFRLRIGLYKYEKALTEFLKMKK